MKNIHLQIIQGAELYRVVNSDKRENQRFCRTTQKRIWVQLFAQALCEQLLLQVLCVSKVKSNIGQNLGRFIVLTVFMGTI